MDRLKHTYMPVRANETCEKYCHRDNDDHAACSGSDSDDSESDPISHLGHWTSLAPALPIDKLIGQGSSYDRLIVAARGDGRGERTVPAHRAAPTCKFNLIGASTSCTGRRLSPGHAGKTAVMPLWAATVEPHTEPQSPIAVPWV